MMNQFNGDLLQRLSELQWDDLNQSDYYEQELLPDIFSGSSMFKLLKRSDTLAEKRESPLFHGSTKSLRDLSMAVMGLRYRFGLNIGDQIQGAIFGLVAGFLPTNNVVQQNLKTNPSLYDINQFILECGGLDNQMRSLNIPICPKGCTSFVGKNKSAHLCPHCHTPKLFSCLASCYGSEGNKLCSHSLSGPVKRSLYYNPISDRLAYLLSSDLRNFFKYPSLRPPSPEHLLTDVYDGNTWKWFEANKLPNSIFIGLQLSWDGAELFNSISRSMWPVMWSILNLPPDLRDKPFLGLHMVSLDTGSAASLEVLVDELEALWTVGITIRDQLYVVGVCHIICDGKGREKIKKVQGASSTMGCHLCHFPGNSFAGRVVYRNWQR